MYMCCLLLIILALYFIVKNFRKYSSFNQIPGPSWLEVFRFSILKQGNNGVYSYVLSLSKKYGPIVKLWLKPFPPMLIVADPKYFDAVLGSKEHVQKSKMYRLLSDIAGNGLATNLDIVQWKHDRKLLNIVFNLKNVAFYSRNFKRHGEKIRQIIESHGNEPIDVQLILKRCTFIIILDYLSQKEISEETATTFTKAMDGSFELFLDRAYSLYKSNDFLYRFTKSYKRWKNFTDTIHEIITNIYQGEMRLRKDNNDRVGNKNFMDLILESGLPRDSIISQMITLITGGYDTTAQTISFALFEIAKRLDIQENIYKEYLAVDRNKNEGTIAYNDIQSLIYTEAVIKETMRIYPVVPLIGRNLNSSLTVDGLTIPTGTDLLFSIPSLHNITFSNPDQFNPERFLPGNLRNIPQNVYAPFSLGPRDCIGRKIAMVEMKFIISFIIKNFTLHPVQPEHKLDIAGELVMTSKNGIPIIFKNRK